MKKRMRLVSLLLLACLLLSACGGRPAMTPAEKPEKSPAASGIRDVKEKADAEGQQTSEPEPEPEPEAEPETETEPEPEPEPEPERTPEPEPEPKPTPPVQPPQPTNDAPKKKGKYSYFIKVNVQANTVTVYSADADGYYTVPARAMVCSTGTATPTSGTYSLPGNRWEWKGLFGDVYGQYATHITGNILFHSVPYTKNRDKSSLEYWEFDKLGTAASMGCIRMQVRDAKWVYDNMFSIQAVQFYKDADPGPLGKPSAPKISGNESCRGWDPTDPGSGNPWNSQPTTLTVADYVGMDGDAAGEQAKDAGLVPETVTADSDMPEGTVIGQSIEPGTTVDFGSTIVLTVSSGQAPADDETPEPDDTEEPGGGDEPAPTEPEEGDEAPEEPTEPEQPEQP